MSFTIEPRQNDYTGEPTGVSVYEHGTYPRSSVLAGQSRRSFCDAFDSVEDALAEYPKADVLGHSSKPCRFSTLEEISGLPDCAPGWFDPGYAGETW